MNGAVGLVSMIKNTFLFGIFLFSSLSGFAQTGDASLQYSLDNKKSNSTSKNQSFSLSSSKAYDNEMALENHSYVELFYGSSRLPDVEEQGILFQKLYYEAPNLYFSDALNPYTNDYRLYNNIAISDKSWISTYSAHDTHLTIGSLSNIRGMYNYSVNSNFTISLGAYVAKYNMIGNIRDDVGINAALKYQINDRLSIHGFGQYSVFAKKNGLDAVDRWNMTPTTNYGGALEYKFTNKFGMRSGMMRELNPMTGKWKNVPFIAPVFYENKK